MIERKKKMKKILALLLVICCMLSIVSCDSKDGKNNDDSSSSDNGNNNANTENDVLARFSAMLANSVPGSSDVVVTHNINDSIISNTFSLVTGTVGSKKAAVYSTSVSTLGKVDDRVLQLYKVKEETVWYLEGYGTSNNKGFSWTESGKDFSPVAGSLSMDLIAEYVPTYDYKQEGAIETLTFTMTKENATKALGNFLDARQSVAYDVKVVIAAAAERISSITISYDIPEYEVTFESQDGDGFWISGSIEIKANYSYKTDTGDIPITLG